MRNKGLLFADGIRASQRRTEKNKNAISVIQGCQKEACLASLNEAEKARNREKKEKYRVSLFKDAAGAKIVRTEAVLVSSKSCYPSILKRQIVF